MAIVKITEEQLNQVDLFIDQLSDNKNKDNYRLGKCGEIAFHNYGINEKLFKNLYGNDLNKSILKNLEYADLGHDFIAQSINNNLIKIFTQIKTTASSNGNNIILSKKLYNKELCYYNKIPQDIFVLIKKMSDLEYDILGFITHDDAVKYYITNIPVLGCYSINKKYLTPIEKLKKFL